MISSYLLMKAQQIDGLRIVAMHGQLEDGGQSEKPFLFRVDSILVEIFAIMTPVIEYCEVSIAPITMKSYMHLHMTTLIKL